MDTQTPTTKVAGAVNLYMTTEDTELLDRIAEKMHTNRSAANRIVLDFYRKQVKDLGDEEKILVLLR